MTPKCSVLGCARSPLADCNGCGAWVCATHLNPVADVSLCPACLATWEQPDPIPDPIPDPGDQLRGVQVDAERLPPQDAIPLVWVELDRTTGQVRLNPTHYVYVVTVHKGLTLIVPCQAGFRRVHLGVTNQDVTKEVLRACAGES